MGNATTFPVQSLFFLAVALGTLLYERNLKVTTGTLRDLGDSEVRVFGDDIIVPEDLAVATVRALETLGLRVNQAKTFLTGRFRESCGVDAFCGEDVTTVSVLDVPKQAKPGSIVSSVDVHNNLVKQGYYHTASVIQKTVRRLGFNQIAAVAYGSGSFGWWPNWIDNPTSLIGRWNANYQVREWRCIVPKVRMRTVPSEGVPALLQYFTQKSAGEVKSAFSSLHYPERRAQIKLGLGWVCLGDQLP
jgi:hypothetical protein